MHRHVKGFTNLDLMVVIPLFVLFALIIFGVMCNSCNDTDKSAVNVVDSNEITLDPTRVATAGNRSFVPINEYCNDTDIKTYLLAINTVNAFESAHPELEIVQWSSEMRHGSYATVCYIYGVFITHRPRPPAQPPR